MQRYEKTPVTTDVSWRIVDCYKRWQIQIMVYSTIVLLLILPISAHANITCQGRFVNPISDICWSCLLPISIGPVKVGGGVAPRKRDTKNPSSPLCMCMKKGTPIPGITLGFWEPVRMIDITRTPYCMVGLGGMSIGPASADRISSYSRATSKKHTHHNSFYHVHYYIYPLIYWLELITDLICLEKGTFDVAYLSEFDPTWNDPKLQTLMNPEAFLFGNIAAQAACAVDCAVSTLDKGLDSAFWCAGCYGNMYPLSGANADHVGGIQSSSLYAARIIAKMHKTGLAKETSTSENKFPKAGNRICRKVISFKIKKSQYKLQLAYPTSKTTLGCWPIGLSDMIYSAFKEYPHDGQDWSYVVWRKKNCCAF